MTPAKKRADEPTDEAKKTPAKSGDAKAAAKTKSKAPEKDAETAEVKAAAKTKAAETKAAEEKAETKVAPAGSAEPKQVEPNGQRPGGAKPRGERKVREGMVVSDRMDKTIVVTLEDRVKHPLYGKVIRRTSKVKAHDEQNSAGIGDRVRLMETRPLSATKRWRLVEIVERAK
jgi:small subunit ribosomal protein S17